MLNNNFNFLYFIVSFSIGMLFVYSLKPSKKIVIKFPNPSNIDKVVYTDTNDTCYKYKIEKKSNCDKLDKDISINKHPILENFKKN